MKTYFDDELDFDLEALKDIKSDQQKIAERLKNSTTLSRIFIICCKLKSNITIKIISKLINRNVTFTRLYVDQLYDVNILTKSKSANSTRTHYYHLHEIEGVDLKELLRIAKLEVGIK